MSGRLVDGWVNILEQGVPADFWSGPIAAVADQFHRQRELLDRGETRSELVERLDRLGVERALISAFPVGGLERFERECELLAEISVQHPGRFGVAPYVPLELGMTGARAVTRAAREFDAVAVRVMPARTGLAPSDRLYYPVYTKCVEESLPITINVGLPGPALPAETQRPLELDRVCRDFPELVVVATHMGWPWHEELIGLMTRHPNLYAMTSAWAPRYYPPEMVTYLKSRGRDKVLFASDHPLVDLERCVRDVDALELDEAVAEQFLRGNATRLFFSDT